MTISKLTRFIAGTLAVVLAADAALPSLAEANFWEERRRQSDVVRKAAEENANPFLLAGLPGAAMPELVPSLGTVDPGAAPGTALAERVTQGLPASFIKDNGVLLNSLSLEHGTVRRIRLPESGRVERVVVHIQDAHLNLDAQRNIAGAIRDLSAKGADLVALEGAWEEIELKRFRAFPDHDAVRIAADYLLKTNRITGPGHLAFTGPVDLPPFVGVDDKALYEANVEAYRESASRVKEYQARVAGLQSDLEARKARGFNPELKAFDEKVAAYHKGRASEGGITLGEYVKTVAFLTPPGRGRVGVGVAIKLPPSPFSLPPRGGGSGWGWRISRRPPFQPPPSPPSSRPSPSRTPLTSRGSNPNAAR